MKQQRYAALVMFVLIIASSLTSLGCYTSASRLVSEDMDRALTLALEEQQSDVISQDTIRSFNSHLQIAELRGKATLAVDTRGQQFKAYAHCSEATIFGLSDQRPAAVLWVLTGLWALLMCYQHHLREKGKVKSEKYPSGVCMNASCGGSKLFTLHSSLLTSSGVCMSASCGGSKLFTLHSSLFTSYGGLTYCDADSRFYAADGHQVQLTPMQHQLMEMFFRSPSHSLTKAEICDALWPKKPDASETLYTLIRRLKLVVEKHSDLKIESDRSRAYTLIDKQIGN